MLEANPETVCAAEQEADEASGVERVLGSPAPHFRRLWMDLAANYTSLFRNFLGLNLWLDGFDQVRPRVPRARLHARPTAPSHTATHPLLRVKSSVLLSLV